MAVSKAKLDPPTHLTRGQVRPRFALCGPFSACRVRLGGTPGLTVLRSRFPACPPPPKGLTMDELIPQFAAELPDKTVEHSPLGRRNGDSATPGQSTAWAPPGLRNGPHLSRATRSRSTPPPLTQSSTCDGRYRPEPEGRRVSEAVPVAAFQLGCSSSVRAGSIWSYAYLVISAVVIVSPVRASDS
jgi:hypothetical protein